MKYSWTDTVYKAFSKSFTHDYGDDALSFLLKCIKDEFRQAKKDENSLEKLYACIGDFYKHFCWKINWKRESLCSMKKSCVIILSYLIKVGVQLSKGKLSSKWINNILAAMNIFPGPLELMYDSLVLINNVKKKCRPSFTAVLNHFLFTNKLKVSKAEDYFKVMLLLKTVKFLSKNKLERAKVVALASKIHIPSDIKSWLMSHEIENLTNVNNKLFTKVFLNNMKLPQEFFVQLRKALLIEVKVKEDFYLPNNVKDSFVVGTGINSQCDFTIENIAETPVIKNDANIFVDSSPASVSLVKRKRKKEMLTNLSTEDSIDSTALVDPSSPGISVIKRKKKKKDMLTNSSAEDSIDLSATADPSSTGTSIAKRKKKNRDRLTNSCIEDSIDSTTLVDPSSPGVSFVNGKDKLTNLSIEISIDLSALVDPSSPGISVVKRKKKKKDMLTNSSAEDSIDSTALIDSSSPGISVVKRKKKKKDMLTNSSTGDSVDSTALVDPSSSGASVVKRKRKDKLLNSNVTKNRNITTQELVEEESSILPQLYNETKGKVGQEFFDLSSKTKEAMSNTFSERKIKVDSCSSNSVNSSFLIDAGVVNQYESAIDIAAETALVEDDSKMPVDSSFDICTNIPHIGKKRKKIELTEPLDTEDNSESNLILKHLPGPDNEIVENNEHEKATAQRLETVSILQPPSPESKAEENKVKSISDSKIKFDQVKSIPSSLNLETEIKHHHEVPLEEYIKANETMPNSERITLSEDKHTDFCEKQSSIRIPSHSTEAIPICLCGDEKEESVHDGKNRNVKLIELHPSHFISEDLVKVQPIISGNNDISLNKVEVVHDKNDLINNKTVDVEVVQDKNYPINNKTVDFSAECSLIGNADHSDEVSKISKINSVSDNSSINLEENINETKKVEYSTVYLHVSETCAEAFHVMSPETLPKNLAPETSENELSNRNFNDSIVSCLFGRDKQSQNNEMPAENKEASPNRLGNYIEGVLYKLVDEVVSKINNTDESCLETSKEKSCQLNLPPIESSANVNISKSEFFSVTSSSCQTFSEISKQTAVDSEEYNILSEAKSNLLDYRGDCSKLEVSQNNAVFLESDFGIEDTEDISDNESLFGEHSFDEYSQLHDLGIQNENSCLIPVDDCIQSKCNLGFQPDEAASSVAKSPRSSVEVERDYENTSDADCAERELIRDSEVGKLFLASTENEDLPFSESSREVSSEDPNGHDFLKNKVENRFYDADNNEPVMNKSEELLELTETSANRNSSYARVFSEEVLQPVVSIKKLENICDTYDELKRSENKENLSCSDSNIHTAQELELEQSNPQIANDESSLPKSADHSQDSLKPPNNTIEKDCLVLDYPIQGKDLSTSTGHLELPLAVSPVKQLRVLRQRKANPTNPSTSLNRKKKLKIDHSDPVLTSNLSRLTLNSPSRTGPAVSRVGAQESKLLRKKKEDIQISDSQPESNKGYNLRSRKSLIQPGKLKC
ncbi:uncharacterized protein [Parasteatoda tepidariorum]|uniref:uncharacterized protein n=1 Tax=Parasteatoda tepidariorum TaxID=114398 RepID=UPI00077FC4C4|nr:uncharacterized protein LOC107454694 [Parasteatoda tepidariorum]XP_015927456.1 uncharacterized protein LOC107454694 [Parasteatoda tepidariorum]XP_015927457.1 uncharacterized protein LOC107454694 [Parasteatoda tepidariorum]XP_042908594.1 uncharacterized protein LOC107454694 [Parasteatoda tepidariorum]